MDNKEILRKLRSIELCMTAHPNCEKGSEFEDRVIDLQEIQEALTIPVVVKAKRTLCGNCNGTGYDKRKQCMDCDGGGIM